MNADSNNIAILYESMNIRVSKVVVINSGKVLMLQKHGTLKWELPGGHVNPDETMKKGACREFKEETGQSIDKKHLIKLQSGDSKTSTAAMYLYTRPIKHKIKLSDEHVNYKWVDESSLEKLELSNSTNHLAIISAYHM